MPIIDMYGHESTSEFFRKKKEMAFEIVKIGTKNYVRYENKTNCAITCVDETNADDQKVSWTYGSWENKENLTYDHAPAETINID